MRQAGREKPGQIPGVKAGGLRTPRDVKLLENIAEVVLDRRLAQRERGCDLLVGLPAAASASTRRSCPKGDPPLRMAQLKTASACARAPRGSRLAIPALAQRLAVADGQHCRLCGRAVGREPRRIALVGHAIRENVSVPRNPGRRSLSREFVAYGLIVMRFSTFVTPGANQAARSPPCRSAHERTVP